MRCVVLTTDTKHHRYFVNRLACEAETFVVLETGTLDRRRLYWKWVRSRGHNPWALIENPYLDLRLGSFEEAQSRFEERFFESGVSPEFEQSTRLASFGSVNEAACVEMVRDLAPDVVVSFGTGLIRQEMLDVDAVKLNVHRGILPRYRGLDSDLWAFFYGDFENVGTTIHRLEPRFDTGAVVDQRRLELQREMQLHEIRYHTTVLATDMVEGIIRDLKEGKPLREEVQDLSKGTYYPFIPPLKRIRAARRFRRHVSGLPARPGEVRA